METLPICAVGTFKPGNGEKYTTQYPHDGSVVAELNAASLGDVDESIAFAKTAQPKWAALMPHQRASVLHTVAQTIRARAEDLARLQRLDNGKPVNECRALVQSAAGTFQYFAAAIETFEETITPQRGAYTTMSRYEPLGVVAAITPWNSPIASEAQKMAPALAAGNAVIVKPAEITPRMAIELARICEEAGVPPGVVSVLPGKGSVIGEAIVRHPDVKRVAFTGGTAVGKHIARLAADKLMPVSLELGGKSPTIVCADADLDHAVAGVLFGIFSSSGESCIAGSRAFVHESVYAQFKQKIIDGARRLRIGDPADAHTQMGPLISAAHRANVERYVEMGRRDGGVLLCGGVRPQGGVYERGYYYTPTIFEGLANRAQLCQEEVFGPVLVLIPWRDEADLLAQCNENEYGLASGIWTRDAATATRIGRALHTGTVWINTYKQFSISTPFGGVKASGLGREKGRASLMEYMTQKSWYWGENGAPLPWAT
jgi:betaine-aldehyde dehydrogenase